ncbi:unnamed protein product, partial [Rotaria sp. Silwood2]
MYRKQFIDLLSKTGILTPAGIAIDMLRLLYEANLNEGGKKHEVDVDLTLGNGGLAIRGDSDLETVTKGLRKVIIEGYNVNLIRLLLPQDNKKYSRNDDDDEDKNVYLKQKDDPRLDKNLTISEFILAFTRYVNIICEVFPQRRRELTAYLWD